MWSNPQETADLVTFTEEVLNGKLHFLCSVGLEMPPGDYGYWNRGIRFSCHECALMKKYYNK